LGNDRAHETYAAAGVDYRRMDALKLLAQRAARDTGANAAGQGMVELEASRGESAYVMEIGGLLIASITECLGTKALVADAMRAHSGRTHYGTIAQDTVAAAVNDLVSVGATPISLHAYWSTGNSEWFSDPERTEDLVRGWKASCDICQMSWGGGETPALNGVIEPGRIDLAASAVGIVKSADRLTVGDRLGAGDAIVLFESSGIHANGISLARKLAGQLPAGYATPMSDGLPFGEGLLSPTVLYPVLTEALFAAGIVPHYCVNITGHGWRKLMRHRSAFTYRLHAVPPVPTVLSFLQRGCGLSDREAYGSLNMGAGFAVFVAADLVDRTLATARQVGLGAWCAGTVEVGPKRVIIEPLGVTYGSDDLKLRD
jgi:phosphoribosylformylglycinamidine cyclo-ligase